MKKQKPFVFIDFDMTKFNTMPALVSYVNQRYGINTTVEDHLGNNHNLQLVVKKYLPDCKYTRDDIYIDLGENFHSSIKWHKNVMPIEGMVESLPAISEKYTLVTVTARQKRGMDVIQYLLNKYVPGCVKDVHCVYGNYINSKFEHISKVDYINSVKGTKRAFIDDYLEELRQTRKIITSVFFNPNRINSRVLGVQSVNSWEEFGKSLLQK